MKKVHDNELTSEVIGAAIEVHRAIGPGLLESAYEECMSSELESRGAAHRRQVSLPVEYKGRQLLVNFNVPVLKSGIRRRVL